MERPTSGTPPQPPNESTSPFSTVLYSPVYLFFSACSSAFSFLRPYAPHIVPALVCLFFIPLVLLLSASAGFIVWRSVAVGWESPAHLQFGDGRPPYALVSLPKLVSQQPYDVSLHLTIPATDSNYALGNFMTTLTISTPSNQTLVSVRRPAIVFPPQKSLFRRTPDTTTLRVPMLTSFVAGSSTVIAFVEIGRRDGWTSLGAGEGREISVVSASIKGLITYHGIRGLVARFPLASAFISAGSFLLILLLILGACTLPTIMQTYDGLIESPGHAMGSPLPSISPPSSDGSETRTTKRRKTRRNSRSSSRKDGIKMEPQTNKTTPLRRRSSRHNERLSDSDS